MLSAAVTAVVVEVSSAAALALSSADVLMASVAAVVVLSLMGAAVASPDDYFVRGAKKFIRAALLTAAFCCSFSFLNFCLVDLRSVLLVFVWSLRCVLIVFSFETKSACVSSLRCATVLTTNGSSSPS